MANIEDQDRDSYENLSSADKDDIRNNVRDLSSTGFDQLTDQKLDRQIKSALAERHSIYTGRYSRLPTLDGDEREFLLNLSAHKATLAEGGEAQSESNTGGNVSYNTVTGDPVQDLAQTRYGRTALNHVRDRQGIGIARSRF